jgi:hypothetical protein
MDVLIPFVDSGKRNESLDVAVQEAINGLNSVTAGASTSAVRSNLAFDEYEQVLTINEVKDQDERKKVISDLERIAARPDSSKAQREAATRVLEFFFAVESRALQHYNRPPAMAS